MQKAFKPKTSMGFSLVELLFTLVVIGILSAAAAPTMNSFIKNQAISSTSNEIISVLQTARSEAIKRSTTVRVCFKEQTTGTLCRNVGTDTEDIHYLYFFLDTNNNQVRNTGEEVLFLSNELNKNIIYKHPSNTNLQISTSIAFNSKGAAIFDNDRSQSRGLVGICDSRTNNDVGRVIQISNTGRSQVSRITTASGISC